MNTGALYHGDVTRRSLLKLGLTVAPALGLRSRPAAAQQSVTMKVASDSPGDHPYNIGLRVLKQEVERNAGGRVAVTIFPDGQLGGEEQMVNGLKIGSVDGFFAAQQSFSPAAPNINVLELPFLFRDPDHAMRALNSPISAELVTRVQQGYECELVAWGYLGSRNLFNRRRPIRTPEDVKGLKLRAGSKLHQEALAALGALPTPMAFLEIYNALQTGVLDGGDTPLVDVLESKFYQAVKYVTLTRHILVAAPFVVSRRFLTKLAPQDRDVVREAGRKATAAFTQSSKDQEFTAAGELKKKGLQFEETFNRDAFVKAVEPVYTKQADALGGWPLIRQFRDAA